MTKWLGWVLLLSAACANAQPRRIYIANDNHTDYMWSGDEETYRQVFLEMIDYYLDLADKTQGNAPEHQSRWHCDGSFWIWTYQHHRTPAQFQRLISRIKDGHISFPLNPLVSTYGGTPTEAVLRSMLYAGSLERRHGFRVPLAISMENQTLPYGLGALWAGSGATRTWKGICSCMTRIAKGRRPHDIYWWNAGDGSRLLMKWNSMFPGSRLGGYLEAEDPAKSIDFVENSKDFREAWPYPVIGLFGKGGDDLKTLTDRFVTVAKSHTTADRKIIVSNINDFFDDFGATQAAKLPSQAVSFGNEWDLYTASIAEISSRVRRAVERLRSAEAISAIVSLKDSSFGQNLRELRDATWMNLGLFWEHNWTADSNFVLRQTRAVWGRRVATDIESYVSRLERDAVAKMAGMISSPAGTRRFYAFNSLNWVRTDVVDIDYDGSGPVHVVDVATGAEAPSQMVRLGAQTYIRILAANLPSVGYKVFEVRAGAGANFPLEVSASGNRIENSFYRIRVEDRGAISSLIDKARGDREFAGKEDGRFFVNDLGIDPGSIEIENEGPVSITLRAEGDSPVAHTSRITLYRGLRRIDIRNEITENFDTIQAWNFSFNLKAPDVRHEELGAILRAKLVADGGHYSPVHSRLEWLTLNHFADMSGEGGAGITLSNRDCAFMKVGNTEQTRNGTRLDTATPRIQVLAGGQIDGPHSGIPGQAGDKYFLQRFALQTHSGFEAASAMKFSLEHQNPPIAAWIRPGTGLPADTYSFLTTDQPGVLLWALKPAEDGPLSGIVARFWNLSGAAHQLKLQVKAPFTSARTVTHIETDIAPIPLRTGTVSVPLRAEQIVSIRLSRP